MEIQIDPHTLERAIARGANEQEIKDVINHGIPIPAKHGRMGRARVYDLERMRLDKYFEHKRVEVIYVVQRNVIVTVTVYVFYGKWEEGNANSL